MSIKNRLSGGLGILLVVIAVALLLAVMSSYERSKRSKLETEQRDRFAKVDSELHDAVEKLKRMPVLFKERPQPLDTVARSVIRSLSGSRSLYKTESALLFCSIAFDDDFDWENTPLFYVEHGRNKEILGLGANDKLATMPQITNSTKFQEAVAQARDAATEGNTSKPDQELFRLRNQVRLAESRLARYFKIVPPSEERRLSGRSDRNDWSVSEVALDEGYSPEQAKTLKRAFSDIGKSWRARDNAGVIKAVDEIAAVNLAIAPDLALPEADIESELTYSKSAPFSRSSWIFVASALFAVFSMAFRQKWLRLFAILLSLTGLAYVSWGFYMRIVLGFKIAITNLYESMIALACLSALVTLIIDLKRKSSWGMAFGGLAAFCVLQIVDNNSVKFDDGISGPMAVLANNIWIHIHVPVIMSAYSFYFVAFLMSIVALPWLLMNRDATGDQELKGLLKTSDVAINLGTIFMLAGLVLGGVWAQVSWGRFWGWDPKETWGLILFLWFLVIVHGRFTKRINPFWNAWLVFFGGNVQLWTYYGTNELLSGLHSYANSAGDGGFWGNFVHVRNRWFVITSCTMLAISIVTAVIYSLRKKSTNTGASGKLEAAS